MFSICMCLCLYMHHCPRGCVFINTEWILSTWCTDRPTLFRTPWWRLNWRGCTSGTASRTRLAAWSPEPSLKWSRSAVHSSTGFTIGQTATCWSPSLKVKFLLPSDFSTYMYMDISYCNSLINYYSDVFLFTFRSWHESHQHQNCHEN